MALPLARLLLPALPACQCQPPQGLRFTKGHVSFVAPAAACSRGHRAAFAARAAASAPAAPAPAAPEVETEEQVGPRTRLVAQNIPWDYTADDIRALFEKHGFVAGVELSMYNASKNRGLAFVTMGSEEEALAALSNLNSSTLNDRKIKVDFARPRKKQPKQVKQPVVSSDTTEKHIVFVGNLTWRVRNRHLRELFASTPGVLSAEVIFHTTTPRRSAGYAFVSFSSKEAAEAAISTLNGQPDGGGAGRGREGEQGRARRGRGRGRRRGPGVGAGAAVRLRAGDDADGRAAADAEAAAAAPAPASHRRSAPELRPAPSDQALRPRPDSAEVGERGGDGPEGRRRREQRQPAAGAAPVAVARTGGGGEAGGRGGQQRGPRGAARAGLGGALRAPPLGHDARGRELPPQGQGRRRWWRGARPGRRRRRAARRRRGCRVVGRARGLRRHRRRRARARQVPLLKLSTLFSRIL